MGMETQLHLNLHFRVKWIYYVVSGYAEAGGFLSRYTHGRYLERYRGIAVIMLGTLATEDPSHL